MSPFFFYFLKCCSCVTVCFVKLSLELFQIWLDVSCNFFSNTRVFFLQQVLLAVLLIVCMYMTDIVSCN
jgi:hypothetical protein